MMIIDVTHSHTCVLSTLANPWLIQAANDGDDDDVDEEQLDEAVEETFPASDPISPA